MNYEVKLEEMDRRDERKVREAPGHMSVHRETLLSNHNLITRSGQLKIFIHSMVLNLLHSLSRNLFPVRFSTFPLFFFFVAWTRVCLGVSDDFKKIQ